MSWLVIASVHDEGARWVAGGLANTGMQPIDLVTDLDLVGAVWEHRIRGDRFTTCIGLTDGRTIDSETVQGTVNRLALVQQGLVGSLVVADQMYALQELSALVLSWLAALPGPVLNPAVPRGLAGAWRSPAEWALLASRAGLDAAPVAVDAAGRGGPSRWGGWVGDDDIASDVMVVGEAVLTEVDLDQPTALACRRLAQLSETPLLGVRFAGGAPSPVTGVTPFPDLRAGGEALVRALVEALSRPRADR